LFYHHECHDTYIYFVSKGDFFSNYMNKKLSVFEFYGYYKIIIDISKNIYTLFICDARAIHFVYQYFDT